MKLGSNGTCLTRTSTLFRRRYAMGPTPSVLQTVKIMQEQSLLCKTPNQSSFATAVCRQFTPVIPFDACCKLCCHDLACCCCCSWLPVQLAGGRHSFQTATLCSASANIQHCTLSPHPAAHQPGPCCTPCQGPQSPQSVPRSQDTQLVPDSTVRLPLRPSSHTPSLACMEVCVG